MTTIRVVDLNGSIVDVELKENTTYGFRRQSPEDDTVYTGVGRTGALTALAEMVAANAEDGHYAVHRSVYFVDKQSITLAEKAASRGLRNLEDQRSRLTKHGLTPDLSPTLSDVVRKIDALRGEIVKYGKMLDGLDRKSAILYLLDILKYELDRGAFNPDRKVASTHARAVRQITDSNDTTLGAFVVAFLFAEASLPNGTSSRVNPVVGTGSVGV